MSTHVTNANQCSFNPVGRAARPVGGFIQPRLRTARRRGVRRAWAALGGLSLFAACGAAVLAALAEPRMTSLSLRGGTPYAVNAWDAAYLGTAVLLAFGAFALWKAAHRSGLGFWQATARPALMCTLAAGMGLSLTFESCFAAGTWQRLALAAFGIAALGFLGIWHLRGPTGGIKPHDDYWHRAWGSAFFVLALAASAGTLGFARQWRAEGFRFERPDLRQSATQQLLVEPAAQARATPKRMYSHTPVAGGVLLLLALGAFGEARSRWKQASFAREILLGNG